MNCSCCGAEIEIEETVREAYSVIAEDITEETATDSGAEEAVFCAFCTAQLFGDTPIAVEEVGPGTSVNWHLITRSVVIVVSLCLLLLVGWFGYNELVYQRSKSNLQSSSMAPYALQIEDLSPYKEAGLTDYQKLVELNQQLPLVSADTVFELDEPNGELCIWFPAEPVASRETLRQAVFYLAAVNFLAYDELQEVDVVIADQKVELTRTSFLLRQGVLRPNHLTQRGFDKRILTKMLNENYLARAVDMEAGGIGDVASMSSHAEVALFLKQQLKMEEVDISDLNVATLTPVLVEMEQVYQQYPVLYSKVKYFGETETVNATMATTCFNEGSEYTAINCDLSVFKQDFESLAYNYRQANNDAAGVALAGANWQSCGVHELGHALVGIAVRNQHDNLEEATKDYIEQTSATMLIENAFADAKPKLEAGVTLDEAIRDISVYAYYGSNMNAHLYDTSTKNDAQYGEGVYHETIAEAFADVFTNGDDANEFSKSIVAELNKYVAQ